MSLFLERISIDRYGALHGFELGSFGPGLNVVYGPNEAGKSSVASFVGGVLFGWEEAHGVLNTYRPAEGERAGSLLFAEGDRSASGESPWIPMGSDEAATSSSGSATVQPSAYLRRELDAGGLQGNVEVVSDIDASTYKSMFQLTSDELCALRNSSDVTARLLAIGAATGSSPSAAFVEIEQRIAALTAPTGGNSIGELRASLDAKHAQIDEAMEAVELLKQEDRDRNALASGRATASSQLLELNQEVEELHSVRARIEAIDVHRRRHEAELGELQAESEQIQVESNVGSGASAKLMSLDTATERLLRDDLDEYAEEQAKAQRAVDAARENASTSEASYEALLELDDAPEDGRRLSSNRIAQAVIAALPALAFVLVGVFSFVYGRHTSSFSFTLFGIGLMVFAFLLATGAFVVMLRPDKRAEALKERVKDAQWVMLQDKKKLDASLKAKERVDEQIADFLSQAGLEEAAGSIRQARVLLDDAREARSQANLEQQKASSLALRTKAARKALASLDEERRALEEEHGLPAGVSLADIDERVREASARRDAMSVAQADMNQRFGELDQRLGQAVSDRTSDELKLDFQQIRCRLHESRNELVVLLLAKRMLEKSMAAWESRSQPEVFEQASRLFATMTEGAWVRMHMTAEGRMVATSASGDVREVRHLSLGTCQQLYLSLRVAMLMRASTVGRSIPVIADDILVNFDANRRARAAEVLAELAQTRQVIVFTCHRETAQVLREACASTTYLEFAK